MWNCESRDMNIKPEQKAIIEEIQTKVYEGGIDYMTKYTVTGHSGLSLRSTIN